MGKTSIEWTDASWNPVVGCTEVSPGCANCYAARLAATRLKTTPAYVGLSSLHRVQGIPEKNACRWTGEVRFLPERLEEPLHWRKPQRIFVCDMGDLFHESIRDQWLLQIFQVMARAPQHTYQILTKRPAQMRVWIECMNRLDFIHPMRATVAEPRWPWPNVWLGVSVENQHFADERIPLLLATPATVRFISAEPLLGPVDLTAIKRTRAEGFMRPLDGRFNRIDWVICGGESGSGARPMHPDWARSLRDQCQAAGVPFFFKQWGEYLPYGQENDLGGGTFRNARDDQQPAKIGKKKAGRLLDGREWNEFPQSVGDQTA